MQIEPKHSRRPADARTRPADVARRSALLWRRDTACARQLDILGLGFENITLDEAASSIVDAAQVQRQTRAVFVNAHVMNTAWADAAYWRTIATADRRYADGSGLAIAARLGGQALADNVNGTDLLALLAGEAVSEGVTIFLLGGAPGAAEASAATLAGQGFAGSLAGAHHGYFAPGSAEEDRVIAAINASGAAILLVGLGVPLQDQWIERNAHRLDARVLIGVGGLFDFYSGRVSRAPALLRSAGLEWTWRLALEPGRMWRRYLVGNATFLARALIEAARLRGRAATGAVAPRHTAG